MLRKNGTIALLLDPNADGGASVADTAAAASAPATGGDDGGLSSDMEAVIAEGAMDGNTPDPAPAAQASATSAGAATQAAAGTAGAPGASPVVDPAASTQQPAAASATQTTAVQQPVQPAAAATGQPTASQDPNPVPVQQIDWTKHRDTYLPQLEKLYAVPEQEVEALRTNPEIALPKLAARLHYEMQTGVFQAVMSNLPQMVSLQMQAHQMHAEHDKAFYDKWPALKAAVAKDPNAETTIVSAIRAFRAANPNEKVLANVIKGAGMLAAMQLNIPLESLVQTVAAAAATPAAQAASVAAPAVPARPAGVGGTAPQPAVGGNAPGEENLFSEMANSFLAGG